MGHMTPATKDELKAALAKNDLQITQAAARINGTIGDKEWRATIAEIIRLRSERKILEAKLANVAQ